MAEDKALATINPDRDGPGWVQCIFCGVSFKVRSAFSTRWWCGPGCQQADTGDGEV